MPIITRSFRKNETEAQELADNLISAGIGAEVEFDEDMPGVHVTVFDTDALLFLHMFDDWSEDRWAMTQEEADAVGAQPFAKHRTDGPAYINKAGGFEQWWLFGVFAQKDRVEQAYTEGVRSADQFAMIVRTLSNSTLMSKVPFSDPVWTVWPVTYLYPRTNWIRIAGRIIRDELIEGRAALAKGKQLRGNDAVVFADEEAQTIFEQGCTAYGLKIEDDRRDRYRYVADWRRLANPSRKWPWES